MSSQKNSQTKYANSNLNGVFQKSSTSSAHGSGVGAVRSYGGMLVLQKKTRASTTAVGTKLAVPKPVNLPSMRKEHAGNDPNTQLVPTGGAGSGWSKPEEPPAPPLPEPRQSSLTAGSTWASAPGLAWQSQRDTPPPTRPTFPSDRRLNPEEYPTLSATARAAPTQQKLAGRADGQDTKSWADDERDVPPSSYRGSGPEWTVREDRFEDERYVGDKGQEFGSRGGAWEHRDRPGYRYEEFGAPPPPPRGGGVFDDDYDFVKPRGYDGSRGSFDAPQPPPPPGRRQQYPEDRYAEPFYDGGRPAFDTFDDRPLFPPPPPPKPGAGAHAAGPVDGDEEDPERRAFEEELARVAAELEQKKAEEKEPEAPSPVEEPVEAEQKEDAFDQNEVPPPPPLVPPPPPPQLPKQPAEPQAPEQPAQTPEQQQAAAKTAALAKAKALKELAEEEERRRRSAAAIKLKELEDRIASREAASKAQAAAKAAAEAAAEAAATAALQPPKQSAPPAPAADHAEDDWERAPAVVEVTSRAAQPVQHAAAPPVPASSPTRVPEPAVAAPPPPPASVWQQQAMPVTTRFGSFDDTLLENIAKSAAEEKAGAAEAWAGREQPAASPPPPARLDATQDAEVPPPTQREAWRTEDGEEDRAGRGGRAQGARASGRGDRGRGRGRGDGLEGERPGSARGNRYDNGSDSDGSRSARGRGARSSTRGGRPVRPLSGPQPKDDAGTAAAIAAATAAMAAAAAVTDKVAVAQDTPAPPKAVDDASAAAPAAPAPEHPAAEAVPADSKSRRPGKPPRDAAQPAPVGKPPSPLAPAAAPQLPVSAQKVPARGPSPSRGATLPPAHPSPPTVSPRQPSSPHPTVPPRRESPRAQAEPAKPPPPAISAAASVPQNIPERRPSSASSDYTNWNRQIVKDVVSMSLDEPVTDSSVHLPASLDPTPPKPAGPIMSPGFERQIGPRHGPKPSTKSDPADDPLGNGMPPLPTSFLDTAIAPAPKAPTLTHNYPAPTMMQPIRPFVPTFNFPPSSDGPQVTASHLTMWNQVPLSFGQQGNALQQQNIAAAAAEAWNVAAPVYPTSSAPSLPNPPPPLMNIAGQFGQFQPFGHPGAFNPPAFGTMQPGFAQFATSQPPFIPTGKQPDWSTGPSSIGGQNSSISPGLGRPGSLDPLLPFANFVGPQSSDGFQAASALANAGGGLPALGGPMFPPPPNKQPPHQATMIAQISHQRDPLQQAKDAAKQQVNLPDELVFGPDSSTSPKNMQLPPQVSRAPPGLALPGSARGGPPPQHQHTLQQQQQPAPPGGKPNSNRGRGPTPDRAGRGPAPGRGRGPPGPPSRRPVGPPPGVSNGPSGGYGPPAEQSIPAPPAPMNAGDGEMGGRGGRAAARGGRGAGAGRGRGGGQGTSGRGDKAVYVPKPNYPGPSPKPSFNGPQQAQKADK